MRNKNVVALAIAAVVLLGLAYLLSRGSAEMPAADAGPASEKKAKPVVFPREQKRRAAGALATDKAPPAVQQANLDAMQRALLRPNGKGAIFIEANAIRHAPLMERMMRCRADASADGLSQMKAALGIDPMQDVDRVGLDGEVFVASGFFDEMKVPEELGEGVAYGDAGRLWSVTDDDGDAIVFGKLGGGMLLTGADEAHVKSAIDRAEGRGVTAPPGALPETFGQGEVYGTVGADFLRSVLGDSDNPVAQSIAQLVTSSTVRMNVDEDAALSLDMQAVDEKAAEDLSKTVGGVFAGLRMQAEQAGDAELTSLLEQARVRAGDNGRFEIDVAVPGEVLLRGMGCDPEGNPLPQAPRP